jgi:hypothetical protein
LGAKIEFLNFHTITSLLSKTKNRSWHRTIICLLLIKQSAVSSLPIVLLLGFLAFVNKQIKTSIQGSASLIAWAR